MPGYVRLGMMLIATLSCGAVALAHGPPIRHAPLAVRPNAGVQVQLGGHAAREPAPFHGLSTPNRKVEAQPNTTLPTDLFSNPLKRHRMAMPGWPADPEFESEFAF